jgi:nucleotide-binding universal stress UspA family protein
MAAFAHILIATDGSARSEDAVRKGVDLARTIGARITFFQAVPRHGPSEELTELLEATRGDHAKAALAQTAEHLHFVARIARAHGVECETAHAYSDHPAQAIVATATARKCDLIAMTSHGRRGVERLLLGSETSDVLGQCRIPVLVYC